MLAEDFIQHAYARRRTMNCVLCGQRVAESTPVDERYERLLWVTRTTDAILAEIGDNQHMRRFFAQAARVALMERRSVGALGELLGLRAATLRSRFVRRNLPSPKRYIDGLVLVRAATVVEQRPRDSVTCIALEVGAASVQSFSRYVRRVREQRAGDFIRQATEEKELQHFLDTLIRPYHNTLSLARFL